MAALRSLGPDDRGEIERELVETRLQRDRLRNVVARLEVEDAGGSYLRKIRWQLDACERNVERFERMLRECVA